MDVALQPAVPAWQWCFPQGQVKKKKFQVTIECGVTVRGPEGLRLLQLDPLSNQSGLARFTSTLAFSPSPPKRPQALMQGYGCVVFASWEFNPEKGCLFGCAATGTGANGRRGYRPFKDAGGRNSYSVHHLPVPLFRPLSQNSRIMWSLSYRFAARLQKSRMSRCMWRWVVRATIGFTLTSHFLLSAAMFPRAATPIPQPLIAIGSRGCVLFGPGSGCICTIDQSTI